MARTKSRAVAPVRPRRRSNTVRAATPSSTAVLLSTSTTPLSSAYPSAYPSEDEAPSETGRKLKPFEFLQLPSELRDKIYGIVFKSVPSVIDLDPDNYRKISRCLAILGVSRQVYNEAAHHFFSTHTIRMFPTYPGRLFRTKKPLLARLQPRQRASITSLELRLGPGFSNPPQGWIVNEALGLRDMINARVLKVMVEVDTSDPIFKGFRRGNDGFYELFSRNLLRQALDSMPSIAEVQFDAYPSVQRHGNMMMGLLSVAHEHKKLVSWGPERGWKEVINKEWHEEGILSPVLDALSTAFQAVAIAASAQEVRALFSH